MTTLFSRPTPDGWIQGYHVPSSKPSPNGWIQKRFPKRLHVAVFAASVANPTWSVDNIRNGADGWQLDGYVAGQVDTGFPASNVNDDAPGITINGSFFGSYRLWAVWSDGAVGTTPISSPVFYAGPSLSSARMANLTSTGGIPTVSYSF